MPEDGHCIRKGRVLQGQPYGERPKAVKAKKDDNKVTRQALDWDDVHYNQIVSGLQPSVSAGKIGTVEDRYLSGPCRSVSNRGIAIHGPRQTKVNRNEIGK